MHDSSKAYEGPQKRELTPRERDILCRVVGEVLNPTTKTKPVLTDSEWYVLIDVRNVLDPRDD